MDGVGAGWSVTAGTGDLLRLANSGAGTSVTVDITIIGRTRSKMVSFTVRTVRRGAGGQFVKPEERLQKAIQAGLAAWGLLITARAKELILTGPKTGKVTARTALRPRVSPLHRKPGGLSLRSVGNSPDLALLSALWLARHMRLIWNLAPRLWLPAPSSAVLSVRRKSRDEG